MRFVPASWYRLFTFFFLSGCMATMGITQVPANTGAAIPLITQAIDENHLVTLKGSVHPLATPEADQGAASDSLQLGRTILVLKSSGVRQAALQKMLNDQQNSKSPNYHKWLAPEQFGEQFGIASQDIQKITQWLESYGFDVEAPVAGRNLIMFSGTHAQLKATFHTEIHSYKVNGKFYWANKTDPQIPAALAPVVSGFSSLNNFPRYATHTEPQLIRRDKSSWKPAVGAARLQPAFTTPSQGQTAYAIAPYDLATIYNVQPLWNAGIDGTDQTIAIVSDSDINPADVDYFRTTFGLPAKKLNILYYGPNPGATGDENEADLDVEWAGAVAKNATIDLVVAANTATSGGIDGAAAYIINNNLASILNVSYAECELGLGTSGNQYYSLIWEQAAAQGITVLVATGDAGSAVCDTRQPYAEHGLSVNGLASTPYNVAVGGTDFYSSFLDPARYWNSTNNAATLASAKSYIPETPWNDSCASPEIFAVLQANGVTDATPEAVCNDSAEQTNFLTTAAGSGGASNCMVGDTNQCLSGYPKPAWQSGVSGIPADGVRDLPDVSLMAGNGLWGSFYVYCQSDATPTKTCDVNNAIEGAGGTSFATPIFAGMLALVQQKTASQQGNVNYVLYKLATTQYANSGNAASCSSSSAAAGNSCMFYDVTDGTIAVPCYTDTTNCKPATATDPFGILPGYDAGAGYDLASGLGSVNAYNLVEGWGSAATTFLPTSITIAAAGPTTTPYGSPLTVNVAVGAVAPATGTPSGDVGITSNSTTPSSSSVAETTLVNGQGTVSAQLLPTGTYLLFARYAGDATFAPSKSSGLQITVTPGPATVALITTRTTVQPGQKVTFSLSVTGVNHGAPPTGTAVFTDTTTGIVLGTEAITPGSSTSTAPVSIAYVTVSSTQLQSGTNTIAASYSGDSNYIAATAATAAVTLAASFTTSVNPASLTLAPNATGSAIVTATPNGSTVLNPASMTFSCPATVPAGFACLFSAPTAGGNGSVNSTLTLQLASPLVIEHSLVTTTRMSRGRQSRGKWLGAGAIASLAGLVMLGLPGRRRRVLLVLTMIAFSSLSFTIGCGGNGGSAGKTAPSLIGTTTTLSSSPTAPTLNTPVVFTAKVTPSSGTGTPSGSVAFSAGSTSLGTATLASGSASLTTSLLPVGAEAVTAVYSGDTTYSGSTSPTSNLDVAFTTVIAITAADNAGDTSSANLTVTVQ
jgi:Pro-kumamolisin, activation domain/Bacterial Ig-like domain (group 3)